MPLSPHSLEKIIRHVHLWYPDWQGFDTPAFVEDELTYKWEASEKAQQLLGQQEFERLLQENAIEEILQRIKKIGHATNLLYLSTPQTGDLRLIYASSLDKRALVEQVYDLLYGPGDSPDRLQRFVEFLTANKIIPYWTFPTYFLFLIHPETDIFVKPRTMKAFFDLMGHSDEWERKPSGQAYRRILSLARDVWKAFETYHPRDMIDIQSVMWVAANASRENQRRLAPPFSSIFTSLDEANAGFNFLRDTLTLLGKTPEEASKRISLTFPLKYKGCVLRMNYGWWLVADLRGPSGYDGHGITLALRDDLMADSPWAEAFPKSTTFKTTDDGPDFSLYHLPWLLPAAMDTGLRAIYEQSMRDIGQRFAHWKASPYRKYHHPEVLEAVLNPEKREALFTRGLSPKSLPEQVEERIEISTGPKSTPDGAHPIYPLEQMAEETGFELALLERWKRAIQRKGQAILYGPPGTGKTFVAEHLARHLVGGGDGIIDLVQFHPAYAYEDFIQGIRPESDGERLTYPLKPGRFLEFIRRASEREGTSVLIIDEINRANLARVFGELMYLLEYRDRTIPLAGGGKLRIPHNVRIIGTMNTADRSIALVDHALRRRFAFLALWPDYDLLRHYHQRHNTGFPVENLIQELHRLNETINDRHYSVGISYFLKEDLETQIEDIWRMEIEPYLDEYFFDQPSKAQNFSWDRVRDQIWMP